MPVDARNGARRWASSSDIDEHANLPIGVLLVVSIMIENLELSSKEFFGPVTLLTGFRCRPQVVHRRGDRTRKLVKGNRIELVGTRQFRTHVPAGTWAHVTTHAADTLVRGRVICDKLRFHGRMTRSTAKLD